MPIWIPILTLVIPVIDQVPALVGSAKEDNYADFFWIPRFPAFP